MTDIERELRETMRDQASQLVRTPLATRALMRRARLRRAGTVAVAGAVLMAVTFGGVTLGRSLLVEGTIEPADRPQPPSTAEPGRVGFIGLPPEGATPSSPISSELVLHYFGPDPAGWGNSNAWVYADGRLIVERDADIPEGANPSSTGFLEQRLTSEGVETMRTYVVSHGEPVLGEPPDTMELRVRQGGRLVDLDPARGFDPDRLLEAESWLPESAWEDKKLRAYVPSEFAVCYDGGRQSIAPRRFVESLPAAAADLLRNKDWVSVMGMSTGGVSEVAEYCWVVGTDEAGTIVGALGRAGPYGVAPDPTCWTSFSRSVPARRLTRKRPASVSSPYSRTVIGPARRADEPALDRPRSRTVNDLDDARGAFKHLERAVVPHRTLNGIHPSRVATRTGPPPPATPPARRHDREFAPGMRLIAA